MTLHDRVKVGDPVYVSSPRNHFPLVPGAKRSVLLAGGIGVTPILSMAEQLHADGCDFRMHYCTRAPERTRFSGASGRRTLCLARAASSRQRFAGAEAESAVC